MSSRASAASTATAPTTTLPPTHRATASISPSSSIPTRISAYQVGYQHKLYFLFQPITLLKTSETADFIMLYVIIWIICFQLVILTFTCNISDKLQSDVMTLRKNLTDYWKKASSCSEEAFFAVQPSLVCIVKEPCLKTPPYSTCFQCRYTWHEVNKELPFYCKSSNK